MDLQQLKTFTTVAEEGHLTRAAERLYTSQPAISAQLKALEATLGVELFDRTPKGMSLTPAGEKLLVQAQQILGAADQLLQNARAIQGVVLGEMRVGVNSDYGYLHIPKLTASLRATHPGIQLSLVNGMSPHIITDIRKGKLDSGFFFGPCASADLYTLPLQESPMAIVAPAEWADRVSNASLEDLIALPWIYTTERCPFYVLMQKLLADKAMQVEKIALVESEEAIREFIKAKAGIALLRRDDADQAEAEGWGVRWSGTAPPIRLNVAVQKRRLREPMIQAWLQQMRTIWPEACCLEAQDEAAVG